MAPRWIISFPCWGNEKRGVAVYGGPLQTILAAVRAAKLKNPLLIINTDWPPSFREVLKDFPGEVRYYSVPEPIAAGMESYLVFGSCHLQAINMADPGDRVALLCGDMSVSVEAFQSANSIFDSGKKVIMAAASSTTGQPPVARSRALLEWSLDNLTPMCKALFWNKGRGHYPWCVYIEHEHGVDFRGFHLHPFAVVAHKGLTFRGLTSDLYITEQFDPHEIHIVQSADELALVERSSIDRDRPKAGKIGYASVVSWALMMGTSLSPRHQWHFSHQINLKGRPDPEGEKMGKQVLDSIEWTKSLRSRIRRFLGTEKPYEEPLAIAERLDQDDLRSEERRYMSEHREVAQREPCR